MTVTTQLTPALKRLVLEVEDDLRARLSVDAEILRDWHEEHGKAVGARRTAMAWSSWRDDRIVQAAVSWVLTTVFVRFAEDNELVGPSWFTGPGERALHAVEAQEAFFRGHPELTDREWIEQSFEHLRSIPATAGIVDSHAALYLITPSGQMATRILDFWRAVDDNGAVIHNLVDPQLSTRFLGDLYQDLSEYARNTFALLQTPEFVEEFILDQTLTPALQERSLEGFKLIDPTCGSGHFLLGAFDRFLDLWAREAPDMGLRERVEKSLKAVYGVDINAFAVAVARFRLTIAALKACGEGSLESADAFEIHVETGDSLIHGRAPDMLDGFSDGSGQDLFAYATEDHRALKDILAPGQYDVVVGNPPYITVKDKALNDRYRELYPTCKGKYALTVPFMERFFDLARPADSDRLAGWTGQITSNSFMKREFGTKIIENFLAGVDLRSVIDTSGAYIPGHGTPTAIIVGRNAAPAGDSIRAVLGIRGEPGLPEDASRGSVWSSIATHIKEPNYEDEWISVVDLERRTLRSHPWNLQGGGAPVVLARIEKATHGVLRERISGDIGPASFTGADEAFVGPLSEMKRAVEVPGLFRPLVSGEVVRDWGERDGDWAFVPYDEQHNLIPIDATSKWYTRQWRVRSVLNSVIGFGGETRVASGKPWWSWYRWIKSRYDVTWSITFAFVATHNHFVLDRGGKVFKQSAPVIKLQEGATENEHVQLLGVLNSSVACFWLKQNSHNKGNGGIGGGIGDEAWEPRYEFTGTTLQDYPIPAEVGVATARALDSLARQRGSVDARLTDKASTPHPERVSECEILDSSLRDQMVALQEELDWEMYASYELLHEDLTLDIDRIPQVALGQRAFEIVMARRMARGELETEWFTRHKSVPVTEIPNEWPEDYRQLVQQRIRVIESERVINVLERPEYKRRWVEEPWRKRRERALSDWLLERIESEGQWYDRQGRPAVRSIGQLADTLGRDSDFVSVLEHWADKRDAELAPALTKLLSDQVVPYLASFRLKEPGLRKWEAWKDTWVAQRREDAGEEGGPRSAPPKYTSADFHKASYWSHRGKLDLPKERFIVYPEAELSTDRSMLLGWAGWNYAEQFLALATHMDRMTADGVENERLVPVLAGLQELVPWVQQWHADLDPAYGLSLGDFAAQELEQRRARLGVSLDELVSWRPAKAPRARRKSTS